MRPWLSLFVGTLRCAINCAERGWSAWSDRICLVTQTRLLHTHAVQQTVGPLQLDFISTAPSVSDHRTQRLSLHERKRQTFHKRLCGSDQGTHATLPSPSNPILPRTRKTLETPLQCGARSRGAATSPSQAEHPIGAIALPF